jgi:hypothetical protein
MGVEDPWSAEELRAPAPDAPVREIAEYVVEVVRAEPDLSFKARYRAVCEENGYPYPAVARAVYRLHAQRAMRRSGDVRWDRTSGGVLIRRDRFPHSFMAPRCGVSVPYINPRTLRTFRADRWCGSWYCAGCAAAKADEALEATMSRVRSWEGDVFVCSTRKGQRLMPRMRDRARKSGAEVCWVQRIDAGGDDVVWFFSDRVLSANGSKPPQKSAAISDIDALRDLLADVVLAVPGVVAHWRVPNRPPRAPGDWVNLEGMNDGQLVRLVELVMTEIERRDWRCEGELVPHERLGEVRKIIEAAKQEVWREHG